MQCHYGSIIFSILVDNQSVNAEVATVNMTGLVDSPQPHTLGLFNMGAMLRDSLT